MNDIQILILGCALGAFFIIVPLVGIVCYQNRSFSLSDYRAQSQIVQRAAFLSVTVNMNYVDIYRQRGDGIRTPIQRKISSAIQFFSALYTEEAFIKKLEENHILNDYNALKIKVSHLTAAGDMLCEYSKSRNACNIEKAGISPADLFVLRKNQPFDTPGVYILFNSSKNKYYVGQATKLSFRINQHFTGHGNGDVYADYKYGDSFLISWHLLQNSDFTTLNEMECYYIQKYNSYCDGYNKTSGNHV